MWTPFTLAMDGHAGQAKAGRRPGDADGDLAAVGDQQGGEGHGRRLCLSLVMGSS